MGLIGFIGLIGLIGLNLKNHKNLIILKGAFLPFYSFTFLPLKRFLAQHLRQEHVAEQDKHARRHHSIG